MFSKYWLHRVITMIVLYQVLIGVLIRHTISMKSHLYTREKMQAKKCNPDTYTLLPPHYKKILSWSFESKAKLPLNILMWCYLVLCLLQPSLQALYIMWCYLVIVHSGFVYTGEEFCSANKKNYVLLCL